MLHRQRYVHAVESEKHVWYGDTKRRESEDFHRLVQAVAADGAVGVSCTDDSFDVALAVFERLLVAKQKPAQDSIVGLQGAASRAAIMIFHHKRFLYSYGLSFAVSNLIRVTVVAPTWDLGRARNVAAQLAVTT